jgi:mannose-6-phosphate isomerase
MLYPLKFMPVYKDYMWGGRNLEKLGKKLPEGIVAESWEISCHPDGLSAIANGRFEGVTLSDLIREFGRRIVGHRLPESALRKFPLLVKLIDANAKLSVQVHPEDEYAMTHENGELGKNEMWYIISATPGAKLIYDVSSGVTKESFTQAVKENTIGSCLKEIEVFPGDTLNIPAGLVHAIGEGIVLAEIQQNSNTTYRVYDYDRVDMQGNKRPLHIEKALDVIDFNVGGRKEKAEGLKVKINNNSFKEYKVANRYFSVELYTVNSQIAEETDGGKFHLYIFTEGAGEILWSSGTLKIKGGDSVLIPAALGHYSLTGNFKALKSYVPDIEADVIAPLKKAGYKEEEIFNKVAGLK